MKNSNRTFRILPGIAFLFIAICFISTTSCKKSTTGATGTFYFHLHTDIDTNEVDSTDILYRDATGRHFSLFTAQFFIYNVVLQNVNGTTYKIPNAYILKDIDSEQYVIGTAPVGTYNSVTFNVGLDAGTNGTTPSFFNPAGSYTSTSTMWYGNTTQGYMFMKIQGFADTTPGQTGVNPVYFSYAIGSESNLKTVTMPTRGSAAYPLYVLTSGGVQYIHIIADYGKLLSVVNFKTQDSTDSYNFNPTLATTIANNIPNMFHYEE